MADSEIVLCMILVLLSFFIYGLKWAVLIAITLWFLKITINAYQDVKPLSNYRASGNMVKNKPYRSGDHAEMGSFHTANPDSLNAFYAGMESSGYGTRVERNFTRRNPTLTQDLPFSNLEMYRNQAKRQSSCLKSPEPLLSQVTRHLSFSNTSCYQPDRTRLGLSSNDNMTILKASRHVSSPKWYTPLDSSHPYQKPLLDKTSSLMEERYSPMEFSNISPKRNEHQSMSTVRITRPGDDKSDPRFGLESILHKRLERTKDNPCSRQSVLSALGEKSRKRSAYDSDNSLVESYSVKKRRRDDLDDFLDSINNPSLPPVAPYAGLRLMKRSYHDKPTLEITKKKLKQNKNELGSEYSPTSRNSGGSASEDSGLDLNSPPSGATSQEKVLISQETQEQAKVVQPAKLKKRKSVTFSDNVVNGRSVECGIEQEQTCVNKLTTLEDAETNNVKTDTQEERSDYSPVFHTGFSPRKSLTPEYLSSISNQREKKKIRRRLNITWKDIQENRREAWRRSQKLLDEIEESLSKERGSTSSTVVTSLPTLSVTSLPTSAVNSLPAFTVSSTSAQTQSTNTTDQGQTQPRQNSSVTGQFVNFIGRVPLSEEQANPRKTTSVTASNTFFAGRVNSAVVQSGISSGSTGTTTGFAFAPPKSSSTSSSTIGIFTGNTTSTAPAVSLTGPSPLSGITSSNTNTTGQKSSFSFQPTTSALSTFSSQASMPAQTSAAPASQNTTAGLLSFNSGTSINTVQKSTPIVPNTRISTTSSAQPNARGFSFSATAVTKANPSSGFSFTAPAVSAPNVSGGFTFTTQAGEKSAAHGGFTFSAAATSKTNSGAGFTFTAPSTDKPSASGGFNFTAPSTDKTNGSGGLYFPAPTSNKPSASGGFQFNGSAANSVNSVGSTFTFTAPTANNTNSSGGFAFNAPATTKPTNSGGFNFGNQSTTPATFNFGSPLPAPGGFNPAASGFASSTPIPTNSNRTTTAARSKQRRRRER